MYYINKFSRKAQHICRKSAQFP